MPVTILVRSHEPPPPPAVAFRRFSVGADAARQGRALGYAPDEIAALARRAARYTDPDATHRFRHLAFVINDDAVLGVWAIAG